MPTLTTVAGDAVSALCFGAMQFGDTADETASQEMYAACRARKVNFFDTAHAYTEGRSETLLGRFASQERESVYLATKAAYSAGSSRKNILASMDDSRARLACDWVDALYLHRWDDDTPLEESFETLAELQSTGLVRHIGVSNFAAWQVMKAVAVAGTFGTRIDLIQPMYNLVKRQAEVEILPMAMDQDIAVAPYSPLGGGLLTGKYATGGTGRIDANKMYAARYAPDWMRKTAAGLSELAADRNLSPATLAVAWVARHPGVTAPIISARSAEQLAPSLDAMDYELSDDLYAAISALSLEPPPATDRLEEA